MQLFAYLNIYTCMLEFWGSNISFGVVHAAYPWKCKGLNYTSSFMLWSEIDIIHYLLQKHFWKKNAKET